MRGTPDLAAETITEDCFSTEPGFTDEAESGIIVSVEQMNKFSSDTIYLLGHEIGHALLNIPTWTNPDEHSMQVGVPYGDPNLMSIGLSANRWALDDPNECQNITQDLVRQIFRGDP